MPRFFPLLTLLLIPAAASAADLVSFARDGARIELRTTANPVQVEILADDLVKLRFAGGPAFGAEYTSSVDKTAWDPVPYTIRETPAAVEIRARGIGLRITRRPLRFELLDAGGAAILRENALFTDSPTDPANHPLVVKSIPRRRLGFEFARGAGEHFYGLGEKIRSDQSLDWSGRKRDPDLTEATFGNHTDGVDGAANGDFVVPFVLSSAGYGLFLDTAYQTAWEFDRPGAWRAIQDCDEDWAKAQPKCERSEQRLYLMAAPDPKQIIGRYTELTGRAPMPPRWMLGYLQSKNGYKSWGEAEQAADRIRAAGFPLGALFLDLYWFGGAPGVYGDHGEIRPEFKDCRFRNMGGFRWSESPPFDFSGHKDAMARLEAKGVKTVLIEEGYLDSCTQNFRDGEAKGFLARKDFASNTAARFANGDDATDDSSVGWAGQVGMIDTTQAAARDWFWSLHVPMLKDGAATFWTDLGEPERYRWWWKYAGGLWQQDIHNLWDLGRERAFFEGFRRDFPERRPFILSRAATAGSQRFGTGIWTGDVPSRMKWAAAQPAAQMNLAISGLPYSTSDVGGYGGHPVSTPAEFTRWLEAGAFASLTRLHGKTNDAVNRDRVVEPDLFPEPYRSINRRYLRWRQSLVPYIYTLAREAFDTGTPIVRALPLEFPGDAQAADLGSEYLLGPSLLVAPVLAETKPGAPDTARDVYLPAGEWIDLEDGSVHEGGQWLRAYPAPLEKLPLFARAGAILPEGPEDANLLSPEYLARRTLEIFPTSVPGPAASFSLYDDDGATPEYQAGKSARTEIAVKPGEAGLAVEISPMQGAFGGQPATRAYDLEIFAPKPPSAVTLDGHAIPVARGAGRPDSGASWDEAAKRLWIVSPPRPVGEPWVFAISP